MPDSRFRHNRQRHTVTHAIELSGKPQRLFVPGNGRRSSGRRLRTTGELPDSQPHAAAMSSRKERAAAEKEMKVLIVSGTASGVGKVRHCATGLPLGVLADVSRSPPSRLDSWQPSGARLSLSRRFPAHRLTLPQSAWTARASVQDWAGCARSAVRRASLLASFRCCLLPDFRDPLLHEAATGRYSFNLDGWPLEQCVAPCLCIAALSPLTSTPARPSGPLAWPLWRVRLQTRTCA